VQGHEQLVEFASADRNGDGIVSLGEIEAMRKLRKSQGSYAEGASSMQMAASMMAPVSEADDAAAALGETRPLPDGSTLSMDPVGDFSLAFGLPVRDTSTLQPVRKQLCEKGDVLGEAPLAAQPSILFSADPGCPYVVCIHAQRPSQLASYTLEVISDSVLDADLIEQNRQRSLNGAWRSANSGGSHIEDGSWATNPQYALTITTETTVEITLQRPAEKWDRLTKLKTLEAMMGFYVVIPDDNHRPAKRNIVHQTAFIPANDISCTLLLKPLPHGDPYIVMPTTFGPGIKGPFTIGVTSDASLDLRPFDQEFKEQLPPRGAN